MKDVLLVAMLAATGATGCATGPGASGEAAPSKVAATASEPRCEARYLTGSMLPVRDACTRGPAQPLRQSDTQDWNDQPRPGWATFTKPDFTNNSSRGGGTQ